MMPTTYARGLTPSSDAREESLLDDAIDDTFPASDPVSHGQPGSIVNRRYAALDRRARAHARSAMPWWLLGAAAVAIAVALLRRRSDNAAHLH